MKKKKKKRGKMTRAGSCVGHCKQHGKDGDAGGDGDGVALQHVTDYLYDDGDDDDAVVTMTMMVVVMLMRYKVQRADNSDDDRTDDDDADAYEARQGDTNFCECEDDNDVAELEAAPMGAAHVL